MATKKSTSTSKKTSSSNSTFKTVKIGNQEWMVENLNVDRFRNGDLIPEVKSQNEWEKAGKSGKPAWCYYENKNINGEKYGKLYNWFAVKDPRGLAPEGWHIPNDDEWEELATYLGGAYDAGKKMKSKTGWDGSKDWPEGNGTDECGFSGLPGGLRTHIGEFIFLGESAFWWTSTTSDTEGAWDRSLENAYDNLDRGDNYGGEGLNVRCLMTTKKSFKKVKKTAPKKVAKKAVPKKAAKKAVPKKAAKKAVPKKAAKKAVPKKAAKKAVLAKITTKPISKTPASKPVKKSAPVVVTAKPPKKTALVKKVANQKSILKKKKIIL